ncbi:uncharacterized protein LTR77_000990 [Saxophila tyrrhenica]|uniref:Uncharacterized protein n=1 Tax=Saxophila tyrrhenica TaxID=1690608 RepID=A0AAV9PU25_9PEZI|nr:hypothetical protein LTR77_000990 [Saxophila tyrrhenica]
METLRTPERKGASSVLNIIKIFDGPCYTCINNKSVAEAPAPVDADGNEIEKPAPGVCHADCEKNAKQCRVTQKRIRKLLADQLKIKDPKTENVTVPEEIYDEDRYYRFGFGCHDTA